MFVPSQISLKRKETKLQRDIRERLDQIEKLKNEEQKRRLEEEVRGLRGRRAEVEQLMRTEDNLCFLQVCLGGPCMCSMSNKRLSKCLLSQQRLVHTAASR